MDGPYSEPKNGLIQKKTNNVNNLLFPPIFVGWVGAFCPPPHQKGLTTTVKARRYDDDHPHDGDDSEEGRLARRCQVVAPKPVFWTANVIERQKVTQPTITTNRREESAL